MGATSTSSAQFSDAAVLGRPVRYDIAAGRKVVRKTKALLKALSAVPRAGKQKAGGSGAAR